MAEDQEISLEQPKLEQSVVSEIPRNGWETLIILQRHSQYDNKFPADWGNITAEEKSHLGRLTEQGIQEACNRVGENRLRTRIS